MQVRPEEVSDFRDFPTMDGLWCPCCGNKIRTKPYAPHQRAKLFVYTKITPLDNWNYKAQWTSRNILTIPICWVHLVILENKLIFGSIVIAYFIIPYSTIIDLPLISCPVGAFLGRFIRNIPLLSDLAVTSDERISVGTGIVQ